MRHNTKAADFVAALHNCNECLDAPDLRAAIRIFHVVRVAIKSGLNRAVAQCLDLTDKFRKLVNIVSAEHEIKMRQTLQQLLSFLLGNTTADTDYQIAIDGFAGAQGSYALSWSLVATNPILPAISHIQVAGYNAR